MKLLSKIWKDPVWNKVISAGIIALLTSIIIFLKALYQSSNFWDSATSIFQYRIPVWIIISFVATFYILYLLLRHFKGKSEVNFIYDEETLELDRTLFNRIRNEILPQNTAIGFLRYNNFAGFSFQTEMLDDLDHFEHECTKSDFEFLNPQLEQIKQDLLTSIDEFTSIIALQTFPTPQGRQTVPPEWELEQPDRFEEVVGALHRTKHEICKKYDELIKFGRRTLKV